MDAIKAIIEQIENATWPFGKPTYKTDDMNIKFTGQLLDYRNYTVYSGLFIETGAAAGDGVQRAIDAGFSHIISIEAAELWYNQCKARFEHQDNVNIQFGRSTESLPVVLKWSNGQRCVIFLDAHPAGPLSAGHAEWLADPNGDAAQDNIIQAELRIILAHRTDHIIIIDDVNGTEDGCAAKYMRLIYEANPNYRFEFWDENLSGNLLYKDKILVAIPDLGILNRDSPDNFWLRQVLNLMP